MESKTKPPRSVTATTFCRSPRLNYQLKCTAGETGLCLQEATWIIAVSNMARSERASFDSDKSHILNIIPTTTPLCWANDLCHANLKVSTLQPLINSNTSFYHRNKQRENSLTGKSRPLISALSQTWDPLSTWRSIANSKFFINAIPVFNATKTST